MSQYLVPGKGPESVGNMLPEFSGRLQAMLQEAPPGVGIKSGWRSTERQAQIFAAHGNNRHVAARPGHSNHEHGLAADLSFDSPEAKRWVHQNAARFGLHFRMGHEPWHIEPIEATADDTHWGRG